MILRFSTMMVMLCSGYLGDLEDAKILLKLVTFPDYHGYITGEAVSLMCLVPEESRNESIVFYKDSTVISQNNSTYNMSRLDRSHVGIYGCIMGNRRSNEKAIHVYDRFPPPLISLEEPDIPESPVILKCSASSISEWKYFRFYSDGSEIFMATSFPKMAIKELSISIQRTPGVYSCKYQVQKLGRLIDSKPSKNVHVSRLDFTRKNRSTSSVTPIHETEEVMIAKTPTSYTSADLTTKSRSTISKTTISADQEMITRIPKSYTSAATETSTSQSNTLWTNWEHQTNGINSYSSDNDVMLTRIYYSVGSLLGILVMVLVILLLCRFYLPIKRKKNSHKRTSFWMNRSAQRKSRKASPSFPLPIIVNEKEDQNLYEQPDPCTTFINPSSSLKPANSQGSFVHSVDQGQIIYDTVQEPAPISSVYVTVAI
ncbi:uncharacterized protein LOC130277404 isoform X2 [Hyla sarda]|uniref:uncharacterized protein LOC130277404 isoform X2 n=1 Tax=Hyla sarda TaxID=327740 RepID=UPI0024C301AE|nr:uncharacterized protein LOC130277404 isoform X2 [Hyla sarda]